MATPNLFNLEGDELTISYSASGIDGRPHLTYEDRDLDLTFAGDELEHTDSPLGTLVTVRLVRVPDHSVTTFTLLLPKATVPDDEDHVTIETVGITSEERTSIAPARLTGQLQRPVATVLSGSARAVEL